MKAHFNGLIQIPVPVEATKSSYNRTFKAKSMCHTGGGSRGRARGVRPPLFLDQAKPRPPLSKGLDDRPPLSKSGAAHTQKFQKMHGELYIEDITRWRGDMNFIFEWQNNILRTSTASE